MATTKTRVNKIANVCVPVADQDRAVDFYVGKLGLEMRVDVPFGEGYRWIEVGLPGQTTTIARDARSSTNRRLLPEPWLSGSASRQRASRPVHGIIAPLASLAPRVGASGTLRFNPDRGRPLLSVRIHEGNRRSPASCERVLQRGHQFS